MLPDGPESVRHGLFFPAEGVDDERDGEDGCEGEGPHAEGEGVDVRILFENGGRQGERIRAQHRV